MWMDPQDYFGQHLFFVWVVQSVQSRTLTPSVRTCSSATRARSLGAWLKARADKFWEDVLEHSSKKLLGKGHR